MVNTFLFPLPADFPNTKLPDISFLDTIAQGAILIFQRNLKKTPPVHAVGLWPVLENVFAQVRVANPFHLPLVTPRGGIRLLICALFVYEVAFSEHPGGEKDKTEQREQ